MMQSEWRQMPKKRRWTGLFTMSLAMLVALSAGAVSGCSLFNSSTPSNTKPATRGTSTTVDLPGNTIPALSETQPSGDLDQSQQLALSIALPLRDQRKLTSYLANLYNPDSPFYHKFLTPEEFHSTYGPTDKTVQDVSEFLSSSGLSITDAATTSQFIKFKGSVSSIEQTFNIQIKQYSMNGQTYYAPEKNPSVPSALGSLIQSISGLDNYGTFHSGVKLQPKDAQAIGDGYTPDQLRKAYGADSLISQGIDGTGQSIAFFELSDFKDADITAYQKQYNLGSGTFERVKVGSGASDQSGAIEVELDMQVGFALAPNAHQYIYLGDNSTQGVNDTYSQIVNDNKTKVVSISWGLCEQDSGSAELQTLDQIFQQGAAQGMAFFAAAGDDGAYDCGDSTLGVDSPADDPYVTAVGGTTLTLGSSGGYGSEDAWSCTTSSCKRNASKGSGGGGGVSEQFDVPDYQSGLSPDGATTTGRYLPDVSANADPNTGYVVYCTVKASGCDSSGTVTVGGTSAAAPLWAAGTALMNQYLDKQGKDAIGNANPTLYGVANGNSGAFHDVSSGTNLFYQAGSGYDMATGLGSADFSKLAAAIASGDTGTSNPNPKPTPTPGGPKSTATPGGPKPTATPGKSGTATPGSGSGSNLVQNPGFESGDNGNWVYNSDGGYDLIDDVNPNHGTYSADLCGYNNCDDVIAQGFQVPNDVSNASLSFSWYMVTQETDQTCYDKLTVGIYEINSDGSLGSAIAQAQATCNYDANEQYDQASYDLSSALSGYEGQTVAIVFRGRTDSYQPTRMFIDDVKLSD